MVETAEPAGSRTISKKFGPGLSAATIRNPMSDLEEKGYLYHPHTSAGRIPTDLAYRVYVNSLMRLSQVSASDSHHIREELAERNAVDQILQRAAQVLGVLTKELGVAVGPTLDEAVLERLELLQAGGGPAPFGLALKSGGVGPPFLGRPFGQAPRAGAHHHHRQRAPRCDPRALHLGDRVLPARPAGGSHRRHGPDPYAVRQDRGARGSHEPSRG